jgi:hypothetical protein
MFNQSTYAGVLNDFENGKMSGLWGFLGLLHDADDGDKIYIYDLKCVFNNNKVILPPTIIENSLYGVTMRYHGKLYFDGNALLLVSEGDYPKTKVGPDIKTLVEDADYFQPILHNGTLGDASRAGFWAGSKYPSWYFIDDNMDWPKFDDDLSSAGEAAISKLGEKLLGTDLAPVGGIFVVLGGAMKVRNDYKDFLSVYIPIKSAILARDFGPSRRDEVMKAIDDIGYDNIRGVPARSLLDIYDQLASGYKYVP